MLRLPTSQRPDRSGPRDIHAHLSALSSEYDDQLNFFRNYKAIESLLDNRIWLYSHINPLVVRGVAQHMNPSNCVGQLVKLDSGRDLCHPGPLSHEALASLYWDRFVATDSRRTAQSATA